MKERRGREREGERWWRGYGTGDKDTHCEAWLPESCLFLFCFAFRQSLLCLRLALNFHVVEDDLELLFLPAVPLVLGLQACRHGLCCAVD